MNYKKVQLFSPTGVCIVGVLLANGDIAGTLLNYDSVSGHQDFIINSSGEIKLAENNEDLICVDLNGDRWATVEVINYSISRSL